MINFLTEIFSWRAALDVLLITLGLFFVHNTVRRLGTWKILAGLILAIGIYLIGRVLDLGGIIWLYDNVSQVAVIGFIILFQPEIRKLFEAAVSTRRRSSTENDSNLASMIADALKRLAEDRTGALFILPGKELLDSHLSGGQAVNAEFSLPITLSIFDPHSPGHDGAILIENGKISRFGLRLPISTRNRLSRECGTRHYAAAGLTEVSDALVFAVSEERGTITAFIQGEAQPLDSETKIVEMTREHWDKTQSYLPSVVGRRHVFPWLELGISFIIACIFWYTVVVGEAEINEKVVNLPVEYFGTPEDIALTGENLSEIKVHLVGPKSSLDDIKDYRVRVDLSKATPGKRSITVTEENINLNKKVKLVDVKPSNLTLNLVKMVEKELTIKPQLVGKMPKMLRIGSVEVNPNKIKALVKANDIKKQELILTTTPIYLENISQTSTLVRKIVVIPGIQPIDKKWPEVEVKINIIARGSE